MSKIFIYDYNELDSNAEDIAMLMALYSRDINSVVNHIEKIKNSDTGKFMEKYYINYGHDSIGDCGNINIFFEDISIIAAKAVEDNSLFNGQESSTRYINFENQKIYKPTNSDLSNEIMENWMNFYKNSYNKLYNYLKIKHNAYMTENINALNAKVFDILRGFIPLGMTTNVAWNSTLRQAKDQIIKLNNHPLTEMQLLSSSLLRKLQNKYPNSFNNIFKPTDEGYNQNISVCENYSQVNNTNNFYYFNNKIKKYITNNLNISELITSENYKLINSRTNRNQKIPKYFKKYGTITIRFMLDYGSFRDIQRHRNGLIMIPLINTKKIDFHKWYIESLPYELKEEAFKTIKINEENIYKLKDYGLSDFELQYYFPMGQLIPVEITVDIPQLFYITELRSSRNVHPTLRHIAFFFNKIINHIMPKAKVFVDDFNIDDLNLKRGDQNIVSKKTTN